MAYKIGETHHIKLGNEFYIVKHGTYSEEELNPFSFPFSGGEKKYSDASQWQYHAQEDWVGGIRQDVWEDPQMFENAINMNTLDEGEVKLAYKESLSYTDSSTAAGFMEQMGSNLFFGRDDTVYKFDGNTWTTANTFAGGPTINAMHATYELYVGLSDGNLWYHPDGGGWASLSKPAGATGQIRAIGSFMSKLYVAYENVIWRYTLGTGWESTAFHDVKDVTRITHFFQFEHKLYYVCANPPWHAKVLLTDGSVSWDVFNFPQRFTVAAVTAFDAEVIFAGGEYSADQSKAVGEILSFNGSTLITLAQFGQWEDNRIYVIEDAHVFNGYLYFSDNYTTGVYVYDPLNDAFSRASSDTDINQRVDAVTSFSGKLYYRIVGKGIIEVDEQQYEASGNLISSEFSAKMAGIDKLYSSVEVTHRVLQTGENISVDYSSDDGATWTLAGTASPGGSATSTRFTLPDGTLARSLKYRLRLQGPGSTTPTVRSVAFGYALHPRVQKQFKFAVTCYNDIQLIDGTREKNRGEALINNIDTLYKAKVQFNFTDIFGNVKKVIMPPGAKMLRVPIINKQKGLEGDVYLTLWEA